MPRLLPAVLALICTFARSADAPLSLCPQNPHYLLFRGKPTILIGSTEHYGAVLNPDFDYVKYLDTLQKSGLNLTRTFSGVYCEAPGNFNIAGNTLSPLAGKLLTPFARSSVSGYANGVNKFDLEKWDDAYFARLKDFLSQASSRGIVVEFVLFCPFYEDSMWALSPLNPVNNVNATPALARTDIWALKAPAYTAIQERLVQKFAAELNAFDNVYVEICNEPYFGGVTLDWQRHIAAVFAAAELNLPHKHLLAQNIANDKALVKEPFPQVSIFNFHYATPPDTVRMNYALSKPLADDETGFKGTADFTYRREAWEFILAGGAIFDHLDYSFTAGHESGDFKYPAKQPGGGTPELRAQFKILHDFVSSFPFETMQPDSEIIATAGLRVRVFAAPGKHYAIYLAQKGVTSFNLTLPAGTYKVEWINTLTGAVDKKENLQQAGPTVTTLQPPDYLDDIAIKINAE